MSDTVVRPTPWSLPPEGFHFEAVQEDSDWITPPIGAGRCRGNAGSGHRACGAPAVVTLMRRRSWRNGYSGQTPWDYCAEHMYGRWIEDGKVMHWRLVKDDDS